jgi:hypothetical protein
MSTGELKLLQAQLNASQRYLEFGAGNSTLMAVATPALIEIDTVESSRSFLDESVLKMSAIAQARDAGRLHVHFVDIGPTSKWGMPTDESKRDSWPLYSAQIFQEEKNWDLILIDGRFRVACCLRALLHGPPETRIMIHDFWNRPEYHVLLPFLDVVQKVDTFGLFRKKAGADVAAMKAMLEKYQFLHADGWVAPLSYRLKDFVHRLLNKAGLAGRPEGQRRV